MSAQPPPGVARALLTLVLCVPAVLATAQSLATSVCVVGQWRSFDVAASSIRRHVLEPLDADAFAVIEAQSAQHSHGC